MVSAAERQISLFLLSRQNNAPSVFPELAIRNKMAYKIVGTALNIISKAGKVVFASDACHHDRIKFRDNQCNNLRGAFIAFRYLQSSDSCIVIVAKSPAFLWRP